MAGKSQKVKIPSVCTFYNQNGCNKSSCTFLHICKGFIEDTCDGCGLSHNIKSKQIRPLLAPCGFDMSLDVDHLVEIYKVRSLQVFFFLIISNRTNCCNQFLGVQALTVDIRRLRESLVGESPEARDWRKSHSNLIYKPSPVGKNDSAGKPRRLNPPFVCSYYNEEECTRENCTFVHICEEYVNGRRHGDCHLSHVIKRDQAWEKLSSFGYEANKSPEEIRKEYRADLARIQKKKQKTSESGSEDGVQEPSEKIREKLGKLKDVAEGCAGGSNESDDIQLPYLICKNYNKNLCNNPRCKYLHLCGKHILDVCDKGSCDLNHRLFFLNNKHVLNGAGYDTEKSEKELFHEYKRKSRPKTSRGKPENQKQNSDISRQNSNQSQKSTEERKPTEKGKQPKEKGEKGKGRDPKGNGRESREGENEPNKNPYLVCRNYNFRGCNLERCKWLHICRGFMIGKCDKGMGCEKNHSLFYANNRQVLSGAGFNIEKSELELFIDYRMRLAENERKQENEKTESQQNENIANPAEQKSKRHKGKSVKDPKKQEHQVEEENDPKESEQKSKGRKGKGAKGSKKQQYPDHEEREQKSKRSENTDKGPREPKSSQNPSQRQQDENKPQKFEKKDAGRKDFKQYEPKRAQQTTEALVEETKKLMIQDEAAEICFGNIRQRCKYGDKCNRHHCDLPYHWQYKVPTIPWMSFPDIVNETLEMNYCNKDIDTAIVAVVSDVCQADFNQMKGKMKDGDILLRRLSTCSFCEAPPGETLVTQWRWFWKNDGGNWIQYGDEVGGASSDDLDLCKEIEEKYIENPDATVSMPIGQYQYQLHFKTMKQTNTDSGKQCDLRRRPILKSRAQVEKEAKERPRFQRRVDQKQQQATQQTSSSGLPANWTPMADDEQEVIRVPVAPTDKEYNKILSGFMNSLGRSDIEVSSIERIQNPFLWQNYAWKRQTMEKQNKGKGANEMLLYHGTTEENIDPICKTNFDWRLYGTAVGNIYGQGSYFAVDAKYPDSGYAGYGSDGYKSMFIVKVLVGRYTKGSKNLRRPPPLDHMVPKGKLFDTTVDDFTKPKIYCVFHDSQYYPEYLVKYR